MRFPTVVRLAAVALLSGALLLPSSTPAAASTGETYPPHVSVLYASPFLSGGYAAVGVSGDHLPSGMIVRASRTSSRYAVAGVSVDPTGVLGTGTVKVSSVLSTTAGRYTVNFTLYDSSLAALATTTQTYTVGTAISIRSLKATPKSYGLYVTGYAAKSTPVKVSVVFGMKTYTKTLWGSRTSGYFHWSFKKTSKGTYTITAQVAPNRKYFSEPSTITYVRT